MKVINGEVTEIILDENDQLMISMLKGNKQKIYISAKNGALNLDSLTLSDIKQLEEEKKMIIAMKEFQKSREKK